MEGNSPESIKVSEGDSKVGRNEQEIWSWGAGTDGQLATGKLQDEFLPQRLRNFRPINSLSCGGAYVIALCQDGRVLSWGRGNSGQLGHGEVINCLQPKAVKSLEGSVIVNVSAGWNHSGFVSENGAIFTCGDGSFGKLGHGNHNSQCFPLKVLHFTSYRVRKVACGMRHTLVLLGDNVENQVYAFGAGKRGQLGISTDKCESISLPQMTLGLKNLKITNIFANGDHSAALSGDGILYKWGRGFISGSDEYIPQKLDSVSSVSDVALGWNHALLLAEERKVIMLGGNRHGALGGDAGKPLSLSTREITVRGVVDGEVSQIGSGAEHSALVTENGSVMTWGWGEHGQLGLGDTNDHSAPVMVGCLPENKGCTSAVYCGSGFSFLLRKFQSYSDT